MILKPLQDVIDAGDNIRAVIRGTGMNQDGRTPGISLPSSEAQAKLIRSVYSSAGLEPSDTKVIEAHGTGTTVGDPLRSRPQLPGELLARIPPISDLQNLILVILRV